MAHLINAIEHLAPTKEREEVLRWYDENGSPTYIIISLSRRGDISINYPSNSRTSPYEARLMAEALLRAARIAELMVEAAAQHS